MCDDGSWTYSASIPSGYKEVSVDGGLDGDTVDDAGSSGDAGDGATDAPDGD